MTQTINNKRSHYYSKNGTETQPCICGCYHESNAMDECDCPGWSYHRYEERLGCAEKGKASL